MKAAKRWENELDEILGENFSEFDAEMRTFAKRLLTGTALVAYARGAKLERLTAFLRGTRISHRAAGALAAMIASLLEAQQCALGTAAAHTIRHSHREAAEKLVTKWLVDCHAHGENARLDAKTRKRFLSQMSLVFVMIRPEATNRFLAS